PAAGPPRPSRPGRPGQLAVEEGQAPAEPRPAAGAARLAQAPRGVTSGPLPAGRSGYTGAAGGMPGPHPAGRPGWTGAAEVMPGALPPGGPAAPAPPGRAPPGGSPRPRPRGGWLTAGRVRQDAGVPTHVALLRGINVGGSNK